MTSRSCVIFILLGTPKGLSISSIVRPVSGSYGIISSGTILATTPLLPILPANLSATSPVALQARYTSACVAPEVVLVIFVEITCPSWYLPKEVALYFELFLYNPAPSDTFL